MPPAPAATPSTAPVASAPPPPIPGARTPHAVCVCYCMRIFYYMCMLLHACATACMCYCMCVLCLTQFKWQGHMGRRAASGFCVSFYMRVLLQSTCVYYCNTCVCYFTTRPGAETGHERSTSAAAAAASAAQQRQRRKRRKRQGGVRWHAARVCYYMRVCYCATRPRAEMGHERHPRRRRSSSSAVAA